LPDRPDLFGCDRLTALLPAIGLSPPQTGSSLGPDTRQELGATGWRDTLKGAGKELVTDWCAMTAGSVSSVQQRRPLGRRPRWYGRSQAGEQSADLIAGQRDQLIIGRARQSEWPHNAPRHG
jgi:hypothetical protein